MDDEAEAGTNSAEGPDAWTAHFSAVCHDWVVEHIYNSPASRSVDVINHLNAVLPKLGEKLRPKS